jgi:SAM-dependent methyltransferase
VLAAAGLARDTGHGVVPGPTLLDGPMAGNMAAARLSSLRQAVEVAAGEAPPGWAELPDEVLLDQGHASAALGHALANRVVPTLPGLTEQLAAPGARILDIGTGIGALALALAEEFPHARVTGIDVLARAIALARVEVGQAGPLGERVELRQLDAADLRETAAYDLIGLPAPFLSETALEAALPRVVAALAPGGWVMAGTNPPPAGPLAAAVARWNAARNGGNALTSDDVAARLRDLGLGHVDQRPTVPGGPILVIGQRPAA